MPEVRIPVLKYPIGRFIYLHAELANIEQYRLAITVRPWGPLTRNARLRGRPLQYKQVIRWFVPE